MFIKGSHWIGVDSLVRRAMFGYKGQTGNKIGLCLRASLRQIKTAGGLRSGTQYSSHETSSSNPFAGIFLWSPFHTPSSFNTQAKELSKRAKQDLIVGQTAGKNMWHVMLLSRGIRQRGGSGHECCSWVTPPQAALLIFDVSADLGKCLKTDAG